MNHILKSLILVIGLMSFLSAEITEGIYLSKEPFDLGVYERHYVDPKTPIKNSLDMTPLKKYEFTDGDNIYLMAFYNKTLKEIFGYERGTQVRDFLTYHEDVTISFGGLKEKLTLYFYEIDGKSYAFSDILPDTTKRMITPYGVKSWQELFQDYFYKRPPTDKIDIVFNFGVKTHKTKLTLYLPEKFTKDGTSKLSNAYFEALRNYATEQSNKHSEIGWKIDAAERASNNTVPPEYLTDDGIFDEAEMPREKVVAMLEKHIQAKILKISKNPKDSERKIFWGEYHKDTPIGTVLAARLSPKYLIVFQYEGDTDVCYYNTAYIRQDYIINKDEFGGSYVDYISSAKTIFPSELVK